jgi:hypothetical protein
MDRLRIFKLTYATRNPNHDARVRSGDFASVRAAVEALDKNGQGFQGWRISRSVLNTSEGKPEEQTMNASAQSR